MSSAPQLPLAMLVSASGRLSEVSMMAMSVGMPTGASRCGGARPAGPGPLRRRLARVPDGAPAVPAGPNVHADVGWTARRRRSVRLSERTSVPTWGGDRTLARIFARAHRPGSNVPANLRWGPHVGAH